MRNFARVKTFRAYHHTDVAGVDPFEAARQIRELEQQEVPQ